MQKNDDQLIFTKLYWLTNDGTISMDVLFYLSELFWPKFVKKHGLVFLEQEYSDDRYNQLYAGKTDKIEFWVNLFLVSDYFGRSASSKEESIRLANKLVEMWDAKLKLDFPDLKFVVRTLSDEEENDYGLTFYQEET